MLHGISSSFLLLSVSTIPVKFDVDRDNTNHGFKNQNYSLIFAYQSQRN